MKKHFTYLFCIMILFINTVSCKKVIEVPVEVQPPIGYEQPNYPSFQKLMETTPQIEIFKELYKRSGVKEYVDSVHSTVLGEKSNFTYFIPRDDAWQKRGINLQKAKTLDAKTCSELIKYLTVEGRIVPDTVSWISGGITLFPILPARYFQYDSGGSSPSSGKSKENINLSFIEKGVFINGFEMGYWKDVIREGSDAVVYLINQLVVKPNKSIFQLLESDPEYTLYLLALRASNRIYNERMVGISPLDKSDEYFGLEFIAFNNYYNHLKSVYPNAQYEPRLDDPKIVFAPKNAAFKKIGITDSISLENYLKKSYLCKPIYVEKDHRRPMFTNLDSILNYHYVPKIMGGSSATISYEYGRGFYTSTGAFIYLNDFIYNPIFKQEGLKQSSTVRFYDWEYFDPETWEFSVTDIKKGNFNIKIMVDNKQVSLQIADYPNSQKVLIDASKSNIAGYDGVIHSVDNLFLIHP